MWKKILKSPYFLSAIFFLIISGILIFSWFRYGYLYGGGDVGLPTYDPARISEITKYIWWEAAAPGYPVSNSNTTFPLQFFLSILQNLGFSPVAMQATLFFILLFLMGYGMFLVGVRVFGKEKNYLSILAGLFYMFNPYMMIQVWHRFIHTTFFLAAAFPFFFILFRSWIKTGKYLSLLFFLLVNFLAVYLYGTLAFILTILTLLIFIYITGILFPWKGKSHFKLATFRFTVGILAWVIINIWWMLPVLRISPDVLSSQHSVVGNLSTLIGLSTQSVIPYTLLGINPFYLYEQLDFGYLYNTYFFRILPWLSLIFLVPGFIIALKNNKWSLWAIMAIVGIFFAKGATSPFGFPYIFGFSNFFPLGVLRNPFEKMGIFLPFAYAVLLALGISWYLEKTKSSFRLISRLLILLVLFLIVGVNLWPMWFGKIFGKHDNLAFVTVPESYRQADEYIQSQQKKGRILHLPLTVSESVTYYYWDKGYSGVEPSQLLFKSLPSISRGLNLGLIDDSLGALSYIFTVPSSENKILNLLQSFHVKYIILHSDIQWRGGFLIDPQRLEPILNKLSFLQKKAKFGDLTIYELKDEYFNPKIELTNSVSYYIPSKKNIYWPWLLSEDGTDILTPITQSAHNMVKENDNQLITASENSFVYYPQEVNKENLLGEMPAAKFLPDSYLYLLIKLKEQITTFSLSGNDLFTFKVTLAGKRLTESLLLKNKDLNKQVYPQIKEYQQYLEDIKGGIEEHNKRSFEGKEISLNFTFSRHIAALNLIKETASDLEKKVIDEALNKLLNILKETSTMPYYSLIKDENFATRERLISKFNLPIAGQYELLQATENVLEIYPNNLISNTFQINDEIKHLSGTISNNFISYGTINLKEGTNEVSFSPIPSRNLANLGQYKGDVKLLNNEIEITSGQHDPSYIDFNLDFVKGGGWYQLTLQSWIKSGDKARVQVIQDTDPPDPNNPKEMQLFYGNDFVKDIYLNFWEDQVVEFFINPATTKAMIRLLVEPFDGCKYILPLSTCLNKDVQYLHEKKSQVAFKDIKVVRLLRNPIFLKMKTEELVKETQPGEVDFIQSAPHFYSGKIRLHAPSYIVFNETYHSGWELELVNDKKIAPNKKFLSNLYGNAWYIENPGEYEFKLEYTPQKNVREGIIVSTLGLLIIIFLSFRQNFKK